jgi:tetratricopeptide (TPR) repeat protein
MHRRTGLMLQAVGAFLLAASVAAAQTPPAGAGGRGQGRGGQNQEPPKNLQVLPKDMTRQQVVALMQGWTQALGVRCEYCHVDEGRGGRQDYAADEKAPKATARVMIKLATDINAKLKTELTKSNGVQVQCVTCHRGVSIPKQLADIMADTAAEKGMAAAADQYRDLRKRYYGASAYDFSENALITLALRSRQAKPDEALQWLQLNAEFNPKSTRTYLMMAQIQNQKGDKDAAIKSVEKAIEIDPENNQAKQMLQQLKGGA